MKCQIYLLIALRMLASILLASANQDAGCRSIAKELNIAVDTVKSFTLYGQPRHPKTCKDACEAVGKSIGFDYYGKQACCCGQPEVN